MWIIQTILLVAMGMLAGIAGTMILLVRNRYSIAYKILSEARVNIYFDRNMKADTYDYQLRKYLEHKM